MAGVVAGIGHVNAVYIDGDLSVATRAVVHDRDVVPLAGRQSGAAGGFSIAAVARDEVQQTVGTYIETILESGVIVGVPLGYDVTQGIQVIGVDPSG